MIHPAILAVAVLAVVPPAVQDARVHEAARLACASDLGHSDVTLFGNGTVRSRRWDETGELEMMLAELAPEDLAAVLERLASEDLSEVGDELGGPAGAWLERCELDLDLPGGRPRQVRFLALGTLPLALSRTVGILHELWVLAEEHRPSESLGPDYEPQPGDVLLRQDGGRYRVQGSTSDGKAVELLGLDQPFTLYVAREALAEEFRRLLDRR